MKKKPIWPDKYRSERGKGVIEGMQIWNKKKLFITFLTSVIIKPISWINKMVC